MWLDYNKERFGYESIEEDWGFACFNIAHPVLALQDMYIKPEVRGKNRGTVLLSRLVKIARERKCTHIWTQVWLHDRNCNATLQAALARDFKVTGADQQRIILTKKVEGEE